MDHSNVSAPQASHKVSYVGLKINADRSYVESDEEGILASWKGSVKDLWGPLQPLDSMICTAKAPVPLIPGSFSLCALHFLH